MLTKQNFSSACATLRSMYTSLVEVEELTQELSGAVSRQDQVSVRMFLSMRQQEIQRLTDCHAILRRQCAQLSPQDGALLRDMLTGACANPPATPEAQPLLHQAEKNRAVLQRIIGADQRISQRLAGPDSFYAKHAP